MVKPLKPLTLYQPTSTGTAPLGATKQSTKKIEAASSTCSRHGNTFDGGPYAHI